MIRNEHNVKFYFKDVPTYFSNIAKGTTDPRVEFCLPK